MAEAAIIWRKAHMIADAYRYQRNLDPSHYEWIRAYNREVRNLQRMQAYFDIQHRDIRHRPGKTRE